MNLLGNALKYTDAGFIAISLEQGKENHDAQFVDFVVTVEDSGKGISPEFQNSRLFAAFSQENPFSNGGLGLSIVKQIVESLRGEISVESALGVGTKISIHMKLPAGNVDDARTNQRLLEKPKNLEGKSASLLFPDSSLGRSGDRLRSAMTKACQNLGIKTLETFNSDIEPTFLITEPDTLMHILREKNSKDDTKPPLVAVCICTDAAEKTITEVSELALVTNSRCWLDVMSEVGRLKANEIVRSQNYLHEEFQHHGWVIEVVAQPCGPFRFTNLLLDGLNRISQPIEHLEVRTQHGQSKLKHHALSVPLMPTAHRSISDLGRGGDQVSSAIANAHSPLISATMPTEEEPPSIQGQMVDTPTNEGLSEYFTPRVLLVDDNAINLKLLVVFAQRQNFRYAEAVNGLQALERYKSNALSTTPPSKPFDFILMDLSMPIMGGLESTRSIRQFEQEQGLPPSTIVALTGLASAQDQQEAMDSGIDMYLVKPVKFGDIKRIFGTK
jgi:CheY-like chemotaxis protein